MHTHTHTHTYPHPPTHPPTHPHTLSLYVCALTLRIAVSVCVCVWDLTVLQAMFGFFLLCVSLAGYHLYLISVNLTTWEHTRAG
jgi:hypothetical protein